MKMFVAGEWKETSETIDVVNPYDDSVIDTIPKAGAGDVDAALATLVEGARVMRQMPAFERARILERAADLVQERVEDLARTISMEEGKVLAEARVEAQRGGEVLAVSAEEAKRVAGEMIPLDAAENGAGKMGFTLRIPCGVVAAITPFNFPLNLVTHKVGPAIAGGNAVIVKPATDTPLSALKLTEILLEAGMPESAIACITGSGGELGKAICEDDRVRKISFTGSYEVGDAICRIAGMKKVTMELGSNSPVIIMDDADLDKAAQAVCAAGYSNAGQVCISAQRILTSSKVGGDFLDALRPKVEALTLGDQLADDSKMGPMVRERDAERVEEWINEAVAAGAQLVTGGKRERSLYQPTILDKVDPDMRVSREELFGPAVAVSRFDNIEDAIRMANDTTFGLSAGVFTQDLDRAMRFAREVDSGNIHINWSSQWRADFMPYGGLKHSGMGKEGPRYALRDMTEEKTVVLHLNQ
ncbi:Succinate-semialdehyde dehydrogenase [NADP(+)] GabD [Maioricimonas rarisocia]|uniref:Succinate-semialdehyde dehydrogenase [NADP(+)] GabD n=1 Tax=Maioricimonas rarisocia TaxID=2528026 RepID=A0A517Z3L9_9PLAN|nr:aldehyde dehydrogenase family protein [Maioricimonas rarisocia]QDU37089.1 Succinate-semialdehyde dehydrogenase [NADP(+)] GabD [Maioricimonas rarisocia]